MFGCEQVQNWENYVLQSVPGAKKTLSKDRLLLAVLHQPQCWRNCLPSYARLPAAQRTLLLEGFKTEFEFGQFLQLENAPGSLHLLQQLAQKRELEDGTPFDGKRALHFLLFGQVIKIMSGMGGRMPDFLWTFVFKKAIDKLSKLVDPENSAESVYKLEVKQSADRLDLQAVVKAPIAEQQDTASPHSPALRQRTPAALQLATATPGTRSFAQAIEAARRAQNSALVEELMHLQSEAQRQARKPESPRKVVNAPSSPRKDRGTTAYVHALARLCRMLRLTKKGPDLDVLLAAFEMLDPLTKRVLCDELNRSGVGDGWACAEQWRCGFAGVKWDCWCACART